MTKHCASNEVLWDEGFYASAQYIYMFLDEGGMDEKIVDVEEGYKDSSQDHY